MANALIIITMESVLIISVNCGSSKKILMPSELRNNIPYKKIDIAKLKKNTVE